MRIFVTGASGWIGSAVVPELIAAGHEVTGLARSDASADALQAKGAQVHRGSLDDVDSLHAGATASDGVIHLGYNHDFSDMEGAAKTDRQAIETIGAALAGSDRPFAIASGTLGLTTGGAVATEKDMPAIQEGGHPRIASAHLALSFADRGVRAMVVRFSPTVHGKGDNGFIPTIIQIARDQGTSAYIGDGANRWTAVHRLDAANLVRLAIESAPAGSSLHAVGEEGVQARDIAAVIGRHLGLPLVSVAPGDAAQHFGWMGRFFGADSPASSTITQELLGWKPTHPGLIADLDEGHYFAPKS